MFSFLIDVNAEAIQRAAANLPSHVFNTLSQVAGQTPSFHQSYGYQVRLQLKNCCRIKISFLKSCVYSHHTYILLQPYTPSQPIATPLLTPSYPLTTPRYQPTPQPQSWATPIAATQTPSHHTPHQPSTPHHVIPQQRIRQQPTTPIHNAMATPLQTASVQQLPSRPQKPVMPASNKT